MESAEKIMELETVFIEMEDGAEQEFAVVREFEMEGKKYALLVAVLGDTLSDEVEDSIFMEDESDENTPEDVMMLASIESDEEYAKVVDFYVSLNQPEE